VHVKFLFGFLTCTTPLGSSFLGVYIKAIFYSYGFQSVPSFHSPGCCGQSSFFSLPHAALPYFDRSSFYGRFFLSPLCWARVSSGKCNLLFFFVNSLVGPLLVGTVLRPILAKPRPTRAQGYFAAARSFSNLIVFSRSRRTLQPLSFLMPHFWSYKTCTMLASRGLPGGALVFF